MAVWMSTSTPTIRRGRHRGSGSGRSSAPSERECRRRRSTKRPRPAQAAAARLRETLQTVSLTATIFWASLAVVGATYAVYPLAIWCLSRMFGHAPVPPDEIAAALPSATLLIAAHNEEQVIAQRLA